MDASTAFDGAGDETSTLDCLTIFLLLWTLPAIWMGENELDGIFDRGPIKPHMMLLDMFSGTHEKILDKICQNVDGRFSEREWGHVLVLDVGGC